MSASDSEPLDHLFPPEDEIFGWIERIFAQGIRRPGYPADRWTEQWAADQFRAFGLHDVALEPVKLPMWTPEAPATLLVWPGADPSSTTTFTGFALPHARPAPDGVEAYLALESGGGDLDGALAVSELELNRLPVSFLRDRATSTYDPDGDFDTEVQVLPFGPRFQDVMDPGLRAGAAGFVGALTGVPWETCDYYVPYDGVERPIPGLWLSPTDARQLVADLARSPLRGRITTTAERKRTVTYNIVGVLPGTSDHWVIVASHHDGPWSSAVEGTSGTALVLAQARYWSRVPAAERPHNLLFLLTSGHMAAGAGTAAFIDRHRDLLPSVVLELHLEHAARRCDTADGNLTPTDDPEARWWFTTRNERLETIVGDAIRDEDLRRSLVLPPDLFFDRPPTDGSLFYPEGVPIVHFLTAPMYLFDSQDTLDKIHRATLTPLTHAVSRIIRATGGADPSTLRV